jgi:hypothetical protein
MIYCPICEREYSENPGVCECGFEGLEFQVYNGGFISDEARRKEDFYIYKFAKRVFLGKIPYEKSGLMIREDEGFTAVCEVVSRGGLALVDPNIDEGGDSVAEAGMLTLASSVRALILNTDGASNEVLDESHVMALFIGKRLKSFDRGFLIARSPLRFLEVAADNEAFTSDNNVLFSKDGKSLICYSPCRPEEEYRVPSTVKYIGDYAFYLPRFLKKVYLPKGVEISDEAFVFLDEGDLRVEFY